MPTIEKYLNHADELAQRVVNAWGLMVRSGNASDLSPEFNSLFKKTCLYRDTKKIADNYRDHSRLPEEMATNEKAARQNFAEAYKAFKEKRH